MISVSDAFRAAVTADARRSLVKCVVDIADPDIVYGSVAAQSKAPWSVDAQLHDKVFAADAKYATLERNRWLLNGEFDLFPDDFAVTEEMGYASEAVSGSGGAFSTAQYVELRFSGVYVLQACSVYFSDQAADGVPRDFTVSVMQGGAARYSRSFSGNTNAHVVLEGFTVYNPDAVRVTVTKMSMESRRLRVLEIIPGTHEEWTGDNLASFSIVEQGSFTGLSLPYGTCTLRMDNLNRRFEPRAKGGLFQSLEERQAVQTFLGMRTEAGDEYAPAGWYYQFQNGWKTGDNDVSMEWALVDIIGLLLDREFKLSGTLPETLEGWAAALVSQLGENFAARYSVDENYAALPCAVNSAEDVNGQKCGQVLMWVCQATETWPRARAEDGALTIEPFWNQGVSLTLDNLTSYPTIRANDDIARLDFTLSDGTELSYPGTSAAAPRTASIANPFLHTEAAAAKAARMILSAYGGNQIETVGRGDPTSEIGDVATVELDESGATTGRVIYQSFSFSDGVLQGCRTTLLQADGSYLYQNRVLITVSGTWTAPAGVTRIRLILGQGGTGGGHGTDGALGQSGSFFDPPSDGADGADGAGGKIWYGTIGVNAGQRFSVRIGAGGAAATVAGRAGSAGGETTFGAYSSAGGAVYPNGYTDIANGDSYGRTGVTLPLAGSSDGGKGGAGGKAGYYHRETKYNSEGNPSGSRRVVDVYPTEGEAGATGGSGFALIYYDK